MFEHRKKLTRGFECEPRLADTAGPDERHEPMVGREIEHVLYVGLASDQFARGNGHVCQHR